MHSIMNIVINDFFFSDSCVQLFATSWTIAHQVLLSVEFSRQGYWSEPLPFPGDVPDPGIEPESPVLQADSISPEPSGKPNRR